MIKGLFKLIFSLIRICVLALVVLLIFHTWTIKQMLKISLVWSLGAEVSIESVKMDWKNTGFEVHGLKIMNPPTVPPGLLADIPLAIVSVDMPELLHRKLHLKTVGINLKALWVSYYPGMGLNVTGLKPLKKEDAQDEPSRSAMETNRKINKYMPKVAINELILSVGDIIFLESAGSIQKHKTIHVGVQGATYYDLEGISDIVYAIVAPALKKLGFSLVSDQLKRFGLDYAKLGSVQSSNASGFLERLKSVFS